MAYYHRLGQVPRKRHTQFRRPGGSLQAEQLVGTLGFHGVPTSCPATSTRPPS